MTDSDLSIKIICFDLSNIITQTNVTNNSKTES